MFFMAVNLPMVSEVALLLIVVKLAQYDYVGATSIAMAMLAISFLLLLAVNLLRA
jgi:sulfate transport system permease protein